MVPTFTSYLEKQYGSHLISNAPKGNTGLVIVIPSFKEPELINTLKSIASCELPNKVVEVIIVINEPDDANAATQEQTKLSFINTERWIKAQQREGIDFYLIHMTLPAKHAGPGLARKIGMDEALYRFNHIGYEQGIIVSLDADCLVQPNYLVEIEKHFSVKSKSPCCSIYFEHPIDGEEHAKEVYQGIINYELYLRYYNLGLKFSGFPYAFHTVGSSFAVKAKAYAKQGGMNRRKAGEDFYFIQKMFPLGDYSELNTTTVFPSSRPSDRVPFGTGRAISKWIEDRPINYLTYHPQSFKDLKTFFFDVEKLFPLSTNEIETLITTWPNSIQSYLCTVNFLREVQRLQSNSSNISVFKKRFFDYFNNFFVLKYMHYSRDHFYPNIELFKALNELMNWMDHDSSHESIKGQLLFTRKLERQC